jgi:dsDNA-specific endonuclease/ATPase MutS2
VASVVTEYLDAAQARGFVEVRLIHGRGIGVQRKIVQGVLARHPLVAGYADAPPERGGAGATIVRLRPRARALIRPLGGALSPGRRESGSDDR